MPKRFRDKTNRRGQRRGVKIRFKGGFVIRRSRKQINPDG